MRSVEIVLRRATARGSALLAVILAMITLSEPAIASCSANVISTQDSPAAFDELSAVDGPSSADLWAVGSAAWSQRARAQTLIEHFDGTSWSIVPSPTDKKKPGNYLVAVSATAAGDAWAVGYDGFDYGPTGTLTLHWNGSAWSRVVTRLPRGCYGNAQLNGVSEDPGSPTNVWAVGSLQQACEPGYTVQLVEHYDGRSWKPILLGRGSVNAVSVVNGDGWAVGSGQVLLRIEGSNISVWPDPNMCCTLTAVSTDSPSDAWAIGEDRSRNQIIAHFDGTKWSKVRRPTSAGEWLFHGVSALSATDVWFAGEYFQSSPIYQARALIGHWDGTSWSLLPAGGADGMQVTTGLSGIVGVPGGAIAVGARSATFASSTFHNYSAGVACL